MHHKKAKSRLCHLFSLCIALTMFQACDVDVLVGLNYDDIEEYGTFLGDPNRQTVIIHSQGANPSIKLHDAALIDLVTPVNTNDVIIANVSQYQILESRGLYAAEISNVEAAEINNQSVKNLATVIRHFKKQNKEVYILGTGFGGYLVQELIATYGVGVADKYLIMGSRLSIEKDFSESWNNGKSAYMDFDAAPAGVQSIHETLMINANLNRLFGSIAKENYLDKLKGIDLSNVTYLYTLSDEVVGPLTEVEQSLLLSQNAKTIISSGDHNSSNQNGIAEGMLEGFGME